MKVGIPRTAAARAAALVATVLSAAALVCCALAQKFETPKLAVVDVQIQSSDLWAQRLKVRMHVQNPNDIALPIKGITYTIEVDGQQFASGESATSFVVPALGEAEFDMNVTTNMAGTLLKLLAHGAAGQSVPYRLSGKVSLSQGLLHSIPFDEQGTFKLQ
ncbi:MAG TPA: LEA type 2 family protein [Steroidobacteraceae bacterium]|jgi:LEA14-like dessication related protein|nr:LEA type 2 family protein [Steroidobacteraceae bacterium]